MVAVSRLIIFMKEEIPVGLKISFRDMHKIEFIHECSGTQSYFYW